MSSGLPLPKPPAPGGCEIIHVPNTLAKKVGPNFKLSGAAAIVKAEQALESLACNFGEWLEQEIAGLEATREQIRKSGLTPEIARGLSTQALDLKGLGATYEHPLVTRIGGSLFALLDERPPATVPMALIDAHVDGARAIVRHQIRDAGHPVGSALVAELERQVKEIVSKAA